MQRRKTITATDVYRIALREYRGIMPDGDAGDRTRAKLRKWSERFANRFYRNAERIIAEAVRKSNMYKQVSERNGKHEKAQKNDEDGAGGASAD